MSNKTIEQLIEELEIPAQRFEEACNLVESAVQNGQELNCTPTQQSIAHYAASVCDAALVLAIAKFGGNLNDVDNNMATPAHIAAIRAVYQPYEGLKTLRALSAMGVSFQERADVDVWPAATVVRESRNPQDEWGWKPWRKEWELAKKVNAELHPDRQRFSIELIAEFIHHRVNLWRVRRFIKKLP